MTTPDQQETLAELRSRLDGVVAADRDALERRIRGLEKRLARGLPVDRGISKVTSAIEESRARRSRRGDHGLDIVIDPELPISDRADEIITALRDHQVIVVSGETGSGKTTQLPKLCLLAGRGVDGWVGITQPRRIAARSISARIAEELGVDVGDAVGYQIRFDSRVSEDSLIKVMTDGILLSETQRDRRLLAYDTIIIDEAHERSLNIDFLLGYLKELLPSRPELRVIITSATIDTERFAQHFDAAPVIEVSGRSYPVEQRYRPFDEDSESDLLDALGGAVAELTAEDPLGDILVFLPGERDIRDALEYLEAQRLRNTELLPLFGRLSSAEQQRIFHPGRNRRIVLATNVAETSLTVPRIKFVIDSGLARISRYSLRSKVQRLPIEPVSQASADQRAGRCGRLGPGICIRLFGEDDYEQRPRFTEPEVVRTNLASVILQMENLRLGRLEDFPFLDPPDARLVRDGYQLLTELGALDDDGALTSLGKSLAGWPLDVRMARLMEGGREFGCLSEAATLAAVLSIQDPRQRPLEAQEAADAAHDQWRVPRSDFAAFLKLWREYHETRENGSVNQLRKWCRANFLHFLRMREWSDIRRQLLEIARESGWKINARPAAYESVHRAVLSAFLGQVGYKDEAGYQGTRNQRFDIFPGSGLHGKGPKWLVAGFLMETSRVFSLVNAKVDPQWIEQAAAHLLKRRNFDPYWSKKAGRVLGYEQVTLYGLPLVSRRRIHYGAREPVEAHRIFLIEALVRDQLGVDAAFARHNRRLVEQVENLEEKQRRRDLLVDETVRRRFFASRVPPHIHDRKTFEAWRKKAEAADPELLFYSEADLLAETDHGVAEELFPDELEIDGVRYALVYRLEPTSVHDGVSIRVPLARLGALRCAALSWLVPGYLRDKVVALIRSLPKSKRRAFVPVPDWADQFIGSEPVDRSRSLGQVLADFLGRRGDTEVSEDDFDPGRLPDHLRFNIQVYDGAALVDSARDLDALQDAHAEAAREEFLAQAGQDYLLDGLRRWEFGALPEAIELEDGAAAYPAVVDQEDSIGVRLFERPEEAAEYHRFGLRRLLQIELKDKYRYLERNAGVEQTTCLHYATVDTCQHLKRDFAFAVSLAVVDRFAEPIRDAEAFARLADRARSCLLPVASERLPDLAEALERYFSIYRRLHADDFLALFPWAYEDMVSQLGYLVYAGFLTEVSLPRLAHYPRYLQAMEVRLDRLELDPGKDRNKQERVAGFWRDYLARTAELETYPVELDRFHWLIEEYRVSIFAQQLGTDQKVSGKRLAAARDSVAELPA